MHKCTVPSDASTAESSDAGNNANRGKFGKGKPTGRGGALCMVQLLQQWKSTLILLCGAEFKGYWSLAWSMRGVVVTKMQDQLSLYAQYTMWILRETGDAILPASSMDASSEKIDCAGARRTGFVLGIGAAVSVLSSNQIHTKMIHLIFNLAVAAITCIFIHRLSRSQGMC